MPFPTWIPGPSPTGGVADAARAVPAARGTGVRHGCHAAAAWAIVAVSFGTALVVLDGAIATVALPTIARDLQTDGSAAVLIVTVYQLVLVMSLLPLSALGDRIGLRRLYQGGQLLFTDRDGAVLLRQVAAVPARRARGPGARRGGGAQRHLGDGPAHLSGEAARPRARHQRRHGVVSAALAPALGGLVLGVAPWPWVFACAVPFAILSASRSAARCPRRRASTHRTTSAARSCRRRPSASSSAASKAGSTAIRRSCRPRSSPSASPIGVVFVRHDSAGATDPAGRSARPAGACAVDHRRADRVPRLVGGHHRLAVPAREQFGFAPAAVGAMIVPWPLTIMVVAPTAGWLSDKVPAGILGGIGMACR